MLQPKDTDWLNGCKNKTHIYAIYIYIRQTLTKLTKTKHNERILKAAREKQQVTYKGNSICLTTEVSAETADQKGLEGYI